ncbi:MAG: serine hydrolase, partial [Calditrichota bacterium]
TALAVMQLAESGVIELAKPVQTYIPWFRMANQEESARITVRQLLNQTSGIPHSVGLRWLIGSGEETREERVRQLRTVHLSHAPGDGFEYSNANYVVLGYLIDTVSGEIFEEYVRQHIFAPLDMKHSFLSQTEAMEAGMATGYRWWFGFPLPVDAPYLQDQVSSGYIISSTEDLSHFLIAQLNEGKYGDRSILSPQGIEQLQNPTEETGIGEYAIGWLIKPIAQKIAVMHHGSTSNFHSSMLLEPNNDIGIVVLTNVGVMGIGIMPGVTGEIATGISDILRNQQPIQTGPTLHTQYLVADILVAILTICILLFGGLLTWWRRQLLIYQPETKTDLARRVILPMVVDSNWSLLFLLAFPSITHTPSWTYWTLYVPDFSYWLIIISIVTLMKFIARSGRAFDMLAYAAGTLRWKTVILLIILVELAYLALVFLLVATYSTQVIFVIALLVTAFLLEIISFPIRKSTPEI